MRPQLESHGLLSQQIREVNAAEAYAEKAMDMIEQLQNMPIYISAIQRHCTDRNGDNLSLDKELEDLEARFNQIIQHITKDKKQLLKILNDENREIVKNKTS